MERFGLLAALAIGCATVAGAQQPSTAVRGHIEFVDGTTAEFAQALRFAGSDGLSVEYEHSQRFIPLSSLVSVDIQTW